MIFPDLLEQNLLADCPPQVKVLPNLLTILRVEQSEFAEENNEELLRIVVIIIQSLALG